MSDKEISEDALASELFDAIIKILNGVSDGIEEADGLLKNSLKSSLRMPLPTHIEEAHLQEIIKNLQKKDIQNLNFVWKRVDAYIGDVTKYWEGIERDVAGVGGSIALIEEEYTIITFKGRDRGFTVTFSEDDMRDFRISDGDFIIIRTMGREAEAVAVAEVKGDGKSGRAYLGKRCWEALGLTTSGTVLQFKKLELLNIFIPVLRSTLNFWLITRQLMGRSTFEILLAFCAEQVQKVSELRDLSGEQIRKLHNYYIALIDFSTANIKNLDRIEERMDEFINLRGTNETLNAIMEETPKGEIKEAKEKDVDVNLIRDAEKYLALIEEAEREARTDVNLIRDAEKDLALIEEAEREARTMEMRTRQE